MGDRGEPGSIANHLVHAASAVADKPTAACTRFVAFGGYVARAVRREYPEFAVRLSLKSRALRSMDLVHVGAIQAGEGVVPRRVRQHDTAACPATGGNHEGKHSRRK